MSDLAEINKNLMKLTEQMGGVCADVKNMKDTIEAWATRLDDVETDVQKVSSRQTWYTAFASGIAMALGYGGSHLIRQ